MTGLTFDDIFSDGKELSKEEIEKIVKDKRVLFSK